VKKIAILLPNLGGGGAERVALTSAEHLARRGHEVDLVLVQRTGELLPLVPDGVRIVDLNAHRLIAALRPLARYLRVEKPNALHAVMWPVTVIAIISHKLARSEARLVVSDQVALSQQVSRGFQRRLLAWTTRLFYPIADIRIACSKTAADDLSNLSGIARHRFEVVYNPISPPKCVATNSSVEALWCREGPRLITVGSLKEQKNHALLLDAVAHLQTKDTQLMILGEGHLRPKLEARANKLGIADRVILPGFAVDPWPYLASADLFVLSSDYEGFPLVLAEAMHAGLRVVSTDCVSGPSEMLDGGRFGRLVRCGDADLLAAAIDAALAEPAQPKKMRDRAIAMSGPAMIARYLDLLTA
jgi:glycosyltransferase involved in cell wall biosynthesis